MIGYSARSRIANFFRLTLGDIFIGNNTPLIHSPHHRRLVLGYQLRRVSWDMVNIRPSTVALIHPLACTRME